MKSTHADKPGQSGFTLVEVMTGVGVFSVGMLSILMVLSQSIGSFSNTRNANRISQTMQYQMESIRGTQWDDLMNQLGKKPIIVDEYGIPTKENGTVPYDWRAFEMVQEITLEKADHYLVELTAEWTNADGQKFDRVMKTWLTANGLNEYYTESTN